LIRQQAGQQGLVFGGRGLGLIHRPALAQIRRGAAQSGRVLFHVGIALLWRNIANKWAIPVCKTMNRIRLPTVSFLGRGFVAERIEGFPGTVLRYTGNIRDTPQRTAWPRCSAISGLA
jgi:hypothetical protein